MVKVKLIFGVIILFMAVYYAYLAWSLRPDGFSQEKAVKEFVRQLDETASNELILVDCWATWCKNCTALEKVLTGEKIKKLLENSHIRVIRFQTQELNDPAIKKFMQKYDLPGLPALLLLKKDDNL